MPPPRARLLLALAALALASLIALLLPRPATAAPVLPDRWRWPVQGEVVARFAYARAHAFAAGARRGVDIAAAPGAPVRSACRGRVSFAGALPAGRGLGVTVRCGALVATHLGLGRLAVRRGARVAAGTRLGVIGPGGRLRLGARRAGDRFGYVDPLALLRGGGPSDGPTAPVPLGRAPRALTPAPRGLPPGRAPDARAPRTLPLGRTPHAATPALPTSLAPRPRPTAPERPGSPIPAAAWAGLVLLAAGVPLGGLVRRGRRRGRRAPGAAQTTTAVGR